MHLSKHDLFQMNDEWLKKLPAELLLEVSKRLLHDMKELQGRLNQNPDNSSRPPTSEAPWAKTADSEEQSGAADESELVQHLFCKFVFCWFCDALPSSALRALRALIAAADKASQNQQNTNLQKRCCTNALGNATLFL